MNKPFIINDYYNKLGYYVILWAESADAAKERYIMENYPVLGAKWHSIDVTEVDPTKITEISEYETH